MTVLPLPFQFGYLLFLVWLLWLGLPVLCWIEVVTVGILILLQILVGGFQLFTIDYYIGCGSVINSFYYVEICSLYTHFGKSFLSWMDVEFYQMLFLHLLRWSCVFCPFFGWCGISHWLICICWTILLPFKVTLVCTTKFKFCLNVWSF